MSAEQLTIRLLATTDLHGNYYHYDYYKDQYVDRFGLISLATIIESAREEISNNLLFDNGDLIQGAPLGDYMRDYALSHEHPAFTLMNALHYDAATLGNHEFNFGLDFLKSILPQAHFPYLCANLVYEKDHQPWLPPYTILEREFSSNRGLKYPIKIGVIGVLPPQILHWDKTHFDEYEERLTTLDIYETVAHYVPEMKEAGADIIVVLAHTGYSTAPYEKGAENSAYYLTEIEDVDAIIAGHQHRRFPSDDFIDEHDNGFDIKNGLINGIPSVMPGSWSRYLGVIDLTLTEQDGRWRREEAHAELRSAEQLLPLSHHVAEEYQQLMLPAHKVAKEKMNVAVGKSDANFYSYLSLIQDDNCLQIVADAQIDYAKNKLSEILAPYADLPMISAVPLFKVGSRKDDPTYFTEIPAGDITFKDVADLYVYPNQLVVLKIRGDALKEWLECAVSIYHTIDPTIERPQYLINWAQYRSYNVDIIKGIEYSINLTEKPRYNGDLEKINESERIESLTYQGEPVQNDQVFLLVTNSYRALVDRFPGSGRKNAVAVTQYEIPDLILAYMMKGMEHNKHFSITPDHNWQINFKALAGTKLLFETSNSDYLPKYIKENSAVPMTFSQYDAEGFALYTIDLS